MACRTFGVLTHQLALQRIRVPLGLGGSTPEEFQEYLIRTGYQVATGSLSY